MAKTILDDTASIYDSLPVAEDGITIRVLTIQPSRDTNSPVLCDLSVKCIGTEHHYEALSYCWGDPSAIQYVNVRTSPNEEKPSDEENRYWKIPVTTNLFAALKALRLVNAPRHMWIDALCINQSNPDERNFQVALMQKIYSSCSRTLIWLGESDKDSPKAFRVMRRKQTIYPRELSPLLHRPWFRRVWVIQEVALAPRATIQCGQDMAEWEQLVQAAQLVSHVGSMMNPQLGTAKTHLHPTFYPRIMESARQRMRTNHRFELREALRSFQPFDATKEVDKIYGVLGLVRDPESVRVDYRMDARDVYQETALSIIKHSQRLDIFLDCLQSTSTSGIPNLPSWVPNWSVTDRGLDNALECLPAGERFYASQSTVVNVADLVDNTRLKLQGQIIGHVEELARCIPPFQDLRDRYWPGLLPHRRGLAIMEEAMDIWQDWKDVACRASEYHDNLDRRYPTGETLFEAFYHTGNLTGGPFFDIATARQFERSIEWMEFSTRCINWWIRNILRRFHWTILWPISGLYFVTLGVIFLFKFMFPFKTLSRERDLMVDAPKLGTEASRQSLTMGRTDDGLLGLFPAPGLTAADAVSSRPGDAIVIFKGGGRPFVIRKISDRTWRLIGDAYIHGIMYGGAFEEDKCENILLV